MKYVPIMFPIFHQVFTANFDRTSIVKQYLDPPIFGRYIRLHPTTWAGASALRAEFYGCYEGKDATQITKNVTVRNGTKNIVSSITAKSPHYISKTVATSS